MSMPQLWQTDFAVGLTLQGLHEKMIAFAETHFAHRGNAPTLWMINDGAHVMWIKTLWEDDYEKDLSAKYMRRLLAVCNAQSYSFLTEAWMTVLQPGEKRTFAQVKDAPVRDDIMTVTTHGRDGNYLYSRYLVTLREPKNFLGPRSDIEFDETHSHCGTMWNLFAPPVYPGRDDVAMRQRQRT